MSHLLKWKEFYERMGLKFQEEDGVPIADAILNLCNYGDKECNFECNSGKECEKFEPNDRFYIIKEGVDPAAIDYEKDYFKPKEKTNNLVFESDDGSVLQYGCSLDTTNLYVKKIIVGLKTADINNKIDEVLLYGEKLKETKVLKQFLTSRTYSGEFTYEFTGVECSTWDKVFVRVKYVGEIEISYVKITYYYGG